MNNKDLITKLLISNYYEIPQINEINIIVYIKNIKKLKDVTILKSICSLDIIGIQKPKIQTFKIQYNFKKHSFNFISTITLTNKVKQFNYLNLYKYYIYSALLKNHYTFKLYNSFNINNLTLIPYIDESYFRTNYNIQTKLLLNTSKNKQKMNYQIANEKLITQSIIYNA